MVRFVNALPVAIAIASVSCGSETGAPPPPAPENLELNETLLSSSGFTVQRHGIFAFWWDSRFDHSAQVNTLGRWMEEIRRDINGLGVSDPTSVERGYYTNVYIHHGEDDEFPSGWAVGVGYDALGVPYMTLTPDIAFNDYGVVAHEAFHVFQSSSEYHFVDEERAALWIIEGLAEWYRMSRNSEAVRAFTNVMAIRATPDLALWEFEPRVEIAEDTLTEDQEEALGWVYGIRPYANGAFLYYLTEVKDVSHEDVIGSMFHGQRITPQEYLFHSLGEERLRSLYTEWAARNAAGFDYVTEEQLAVSDYEFFAQRMPDRHIHEKPYVHDLEGDSVTGVYESDDLYRPKAWGYNVIRINNPPVGAYSLSIHGDELGSAGTPAHFRGRAVVKNAEGRVTYHPVLMDDTLSGTVTVDIKSSDHEILLVVASVPALFTTNESFGYSIEIRQP